MSADASKTSAPPVKVLSPVWEKKKQGHDDPKSRNTTTPGQNLHYHRESCLRPQPPVLQLDTGPAYVLDELRELKGSAQ
jgi:hypothetical protein